MAASQSDKFKKVGASTVTTLAAPGKALAATSINVGSTTNYPTDTGITIAIRQVDTNGELVAGTYTTWDATVTSATSLAISSTPSYGSDQVYPAGSTTQVYIPVSGDAHNDMVDGILQEHNQDGTHSDITADTVTATTGTFDNIIVGSQAPTADWTTAAATVSSVTANGNRSYTVVTNNDLSGTIQPGTRIRTTRTVAAPTQSTLLNGSTQYWSKSSPNKLTFTDDFVVSAWVKLSSYGATNNDIVSRFNGTSGWRLTINASGQVALIGYNASSSNFSQILSYQSVPLNKWVHVTAQLDMSTYTATTTTSYIMIDGTDAPAAVNRGGTNPTSLVQAGNLEVGSFNGGNGFFPGKIAQVAIFNAKVTQATIRSYMSQGLSGSEASLASAYSFNGVATDLNTTSPNDLTASGSAVATNADSPFGGQADGTISSTLDYGIIQSISGTTIVVQAPEGCTIPTSGGVSALSYSTAKSPYGFDIDGGKWTVESLYRADFSQASPVNGTWYNLGSMSINMPIGSWGEFGYSIASGADRASGGRTDSNLTLSTANNTESDPEFTTVQAGSNLTFSAVTMGVSRYRSVSSAARYYINARVNQASMSALYTFGTSGWGMSRIFAKNAYL